MPQSKWFRQCVKESNWLQHSPAESVCICPRPQCFAILHPQKFDSQYILRFLFEVVPHYQSGHGPSSSLRLTAPPATICIICAVCAMGFISFWASLYWFCFEQVSGGFLLHPAVPCCGRPMFISIACEHEEHTDVLTRRHMCP
jgi:hypothetical protein